MHAAIILRDVEDVQAVLAASDAEVLRLAGVAAQKGVIVAGLSASQEKTERFVDAGRKRAHVGVLCC
jgi:hypothetical protein